MISEKRKKGMARWNASWAASRAHRAAAVDHEPKPPAREAIQLLPPRSCQFIAGQPSADDGCKCGAPVKAGSAYCEDHDRLCHHRPLSLGLTGAARQDAYKGLRAIEDARADK